MAALHALAAPAFAPSAHAPSSLASLSRKAALDATTGPGADPAGAIQADIEVM